MNNTSLGRFRSHKRSVRRLKHRGLLALGRRLRARCDGRRRIIANLLCYRIPCGNRSAHGSDSVLQNRSNRSDAALDTGGAFGCNLATLAHRRVDQRGSSRPEPAFDTGHEISTDLVSFAHRGINQSHSSHRRIHDGPTIGRSCINNRGSLAARTFNLREGAVGNAGILLGLINGGSSLRTGRCHIGRNRSTSGGFLDK